MPNKSIRRTTITLAILAICAQNAAHAGYTVMDDDLFPTNAIPASAAPRYYAAPAPSYRTNNRTDSAETYSILFRKNIWGLSDEGKKIVLDLIPSMQGKQILIIGRPDASPNQYLAEQRSNWLRSWLTQQGISVSHIDTETKNTANTAISNQYPIELQIIGQAESRPAPTTATVTQNIRTLITPVASTVPAPPLTDSRIDTVRRIAQTAQAGRIDAKDAIVMIAELLSAAATQTTPVTSPVPTPVLAARPVPIPPPAPAFMLVATPATARPKDWYLSASKTLKDNVVEWAKTESYTVDWRAANYFQVGRSTTLSGELLDSVDKVRMVAGLEMNVWKKDRLICISDAKNPCPKRN